jgi:hypothetical protein
MRLSSSFMPHLQRRKTYSSVSGHCRMLLRMAVKYSRPSAVTGVLLVGRWPHRRLQHLICLGSRGPVFRDSERGLGDKTGAVLQTYKETLTARRRAARVGQACCRGKGRGLADIFPIRVSYASDNSHVSALFICVLFCWQLEESFVVRFPTSGFLRCEC